MRWPWQAAAPAPVDPADAEARFTEDYLAEFGRLHRVVSSSGIIVTRLNMGMFHQGALRHATLRAQGHGRVPKNLDALERRLRLQACDTFDHWHTD